MLSSLSIQHRLSTFAGAFTAIVIALSLSILAGLHAIDEKLEILEGRPLQAAQLLAEISHHLADFRVAQIDMALATNRNDRAKAATAVQRDRLSINMLLSEFVRIEQIRPDPATFQHAWAGLLERHDAWESQLRNDDRGRIKELTENVGPLYTQVDEEIEKLHAAAFQTVHEQADGVDDLIHVTIEWTTGLSICGILLAVLLAYRTRVVITRPLRSITEALTKLSQGNRQVVLPALHRRDEIGEMASAFEIFRANAAELEAAHAATQIAQEQAELLARHDALTGLPNRRVFTQELERSVAKAEMGLSVCSILMIDLDRFKPVNDTLGHAIGDMVLCEVATRLRSVLGAEDIAARLGGDEFAIILRSEQEDQPQYAREVAEKALTLLEQPMDLNGTVIEISSTIGIALCPQDACEPEALLRAADLALFQGKREGRSRLSWFEPQMEEGLRRSADLERDLRAAIENADIRPFYQPLVSMKDGEIYGFELLARWHDELRGEVSPEIFVPLAEQMGLISSMTWSLLRQGCRDAQDWPKHMTLSVNISCVQLKDPNLPLQILAILAEEGLQPGRLEVEVTESALASDLNTARYILQALRAAGVRTSLDDFGAGYSNLYMLRELNFDKVKIDRSFVLAMKNDQESETIVSAVISLAKNLGLPAVAEGVESQETVQMLADLGCELAQGYHYGRPTSAALAKKVATGKTQLAAG